jgi:hypothetical protein
MAEPYRTNDKLKERLDVLDDVSDDYRQGWLDCAEYYLWLKTAPTNVTTTP